jgi:hypothetical protein
LRDVVLGDESAASDHYLGWMESVAAVRCEGTAGKCGSGLAPYASDETLRLGGWLQIEIACEPSGELLVGNYGHRAVAEPVQQPHQLA